MKKMTLMLAGMVALLVSACSGGDAFRLGPGVSRELARERKAAVRDLRYELFFDLPRERTSPVEGRASIRFSLGKAGRTVLDFREGKDRIGSLKVNGQVVEDAWVNEHIVLPAGCMKEGENCVEVRFVAGDQSLNRNDDYLYTLLVPDRARTLFPCFDQPDLKAPYDLSLEIPEDWTAVANGSVVKEEKGEGRKTLHFRRTDPLSTYLFSFVAGRWQKVTEERDGREINLYHRETDPRKVAQCGYILDQIYKAIAWMEEYTGIPCPFEKYDLAIVPGFQFGGMEHPGAVLYNANTMFLGESPGIKEELKRLEVITHETAHMWFGDAVTMKWFDDVWTKEVFANFFADRMSRPHFPQVDFRLGALAGFYDLAYREDRTEGSNAIRQPLDNLNKAGLIYGFIVYQKAPVVMDMMERLMGKENFRVGMQEYLKTYFHGNADWDGLIAILDRHTPKDLAAWSRAWVDEKGMPQISASLEDGRLVVKTEDVWGRGLVWPQQVSFLLVEETGGSPAFSVEKVKVELDSAVVSVPVKGGGCVFPNVDGDGYGFFRMDEASMEFALNRLETFFQEPVARFATLMNLHENMLDGGLDPVRFVEKMLPLLEEEKEDLIYSALMGYVRNAVLYADGRTGGKVEDFLWDMASRPQGGFRQEDAFRTLLGMWRKPSTTARIYRVWKREKVCAGLRTSERDEMRMAYELGIRMPEQWKGIVEEEAARIGNPDRRREFRFVARALAPDRTVRDSLFRSLRQAENRRIEPWTCEMLYLLNHPLREKESVAYIRPALEMLPEVQRTGDIFFPKNWISACLRGHRSAAAAAEVKHFLQTRPDFCPLLTNKVLQSADHLFRLERLR